MKNRVDPGRIVCTMEESLKDELSKPKLRNLVLTSIAIGKTEKLRVNQIASNLPVDVKNRKCKQTRLMRFLDGYLPLDSIMFSWIRFTLQKVYRRKIHKIMVLVDEVDLVNDYSSHTIQE